MADDTNNQPGWLDSFLSDLKTITQPGALSDLGGYAKELVKPFIPFPGIAKVLSGDTTPQDLGELLNPMPEAVSKITGAGLDAVEKHFGSDSRKFIEDWMNSLPATHELMPRVPATEDVGRLLSGEEGAIKPPSLKGELPTSTPTSTPILDMVKEATAPSRLEGPGKIETTVSKGRPPIEGEPPVEAPPPSPFVQKIKNFLDDSITQRDLGRGIIREEAGKTIQQQAQEGASLMSDLNRWYSMSKEDSLNFIDHIETGDINTIKDIKDRSLAYELSNALLKRRNDIFEMEKKDGVSYFQSIVQNYFPHIWDDPPKAAELFDRLITKRTISEGSQAFLHTRDVDSTAQGVALGLNLKSWNPVETTLMKASEMDRFKMAHNIKDNMVDSGLFIEAGATEEIFTHPAATKTTVVSAIPKGWVKVNDAIFGSKHYYAPPDVARDFNRFFSPGLTGSPLYDVVRGVSNNLTMAQLGLSGFHALFEGVNSTVSDLALGMEQVSQGRISDAALSTARAASVIGSPIGDVIAGDRAMREYLNPGSYAKYVEESKWYQKPWRKLVEATTSEQPETKGAIARSGGRVGLDPIYLNKAVAGFREAIRDGNWPKAVAKSLPAILEMSSRPLMQWYVPRIKEGAFQKLAANIFEQAQKEGWPDPLLTREIQKARDSIDNRFGQLQYSNLFWNKAAKDLSLIAVRAPGWNIGTIRELGGGMLDLTQQMGRAVAENKFQLTHRMAYSIALPITAGYIGALVNYGLSGQWPQEVKDYYYPRDGTFDANNNPNRIQLPSYIRDLMSMTRHPIKSAIAKMNPLIDTTLGILENKDFYNTEVRHPDDPLPNQSADLAKYLAEQMTPFSLRNYKSRGGQINADALGTLVQSLVGILPAPREFIRTPAENMVAEYMPRHLSAGPITKEEAANREYKRTADSAFRRGQIGIGDLTKAVGVGKLTSQQVVTMVRDKNLPTIVRDIKILNPEEAFNVFKVASPQEKAVIKDSVAKAIVKKIQSDPINREAWLDRLMKVNGVEPKDPTTY